MARTDAAAPATNGRLPRVDGPLKVSGTALYTSDHNFPGMLYAVPVCATIANGKIASLEARSAEAMPGVLAVYRHGHSGRVFRSAPAPGFTFYLNERRPPFEDEIVRYYGQYVAVVVARTFEQATAAAKAVDVAYEAEEPDVRHHLEASDEPKVDSERGDAEAAFASAEVRIDQTYGTPVETHNPIELHATVALWDGDSVTLYETSQGVVNHRDVLAAMLGLPPEKVRVISRFLGSGFGGKLFPWPHSAIAASAARELGRPVKLVVSRDMMFMNVGHRPRTQQRIRLGARRDGKLAALIHDSLNHTSILDDYEENCGEATPYSYSTPNLRSTSGLVRRNVGAPTAMRGPGAVPGLYALESAMDELAIELGKDPIELRILNEPLKDEGLDLPFSSRHLVECLRTGAEKFGWSERNPAVGSMQKDGVTLGWGVAGCSWIAERFEAEAVLELYDDGTARVSSATQDIGTGTYTVLSQVVSELTGIPHEKIAVVLGDTNLVPGPLSGGSMVTASLIPAVADALEKAQQSLFLIASQREGTPLSSKDPDALAFTAGMVHLKDQPPEHGVPFQEILFAGNVRSVIGYGKSLATFGEEHPTRSRHSFGAQFAEVTWQPEIARLRVSRVVTVIDAGRIINPKPARNQIEGAVVMGVGMALFEATRYDARYGVPINSNLADYMVTTNADAPEIDVTFVDHPDMALNSLGARGVGEIGLAGIAAAITAAVYHATGVRVRELPVTIEDLLRSEAAGTSGLALRH
jgi:xanthine dehydrogenase YagR molybdenum-binding subunit